MAMKTRRPARTRLRRLAMPDAPSIILADLTPDEIGRFKVAKVGYTGATPADIVHAYIATYFACLPAALAALGWKKVRIRVRGGQWIVRRKRKS